MSTTDLDEDDEPPVTHRHASAPPPASSRARSLFIDAFCATAYVLGMRPEEIADALDEPPPPWMNAIARAPSAAGRSRILAPSLMDLEESLARTRLR